MKILKSLRNKFRIAFRKYYEARISLPYGIAQFIGNVAQIQLNTREYLVLNPPSKYLGDIRVTTFDSRPLLTYKWWPNGAEWKEQMPEVECIVELRGFQIRDLGKNEWEIMKDFEDPRLVHLKDLFLSFAFYPSLREEHKRAINP